MSGICISNEKKQSDHVVPVMGNLLIIKQADGVKLTEVTPNGNWTKTELVSTLADEYDWIAENLKCTYPLFAFLGNVEIGSYSKGGLILKI